MNIKKILSLDKKLSLKSKIDGSKVVYRKSPFSATRNFVTLELTNKFIGSGRWLRDTLIRMDSQRQDIVSRVYWNNMKMRTKKNDNRTSREIAEVMANGGDTFIN